jgi:hypothetical protein
VEASESRHGRAHDGDEQGRLQKQGPLVNAAVAKLPSQNPLLLPKTISPIRRVNIEILMNGLIAARFDDFE